MEISVKNILDLQAEIIRLEKRRQEQEIVLKQRVSTPAAIFSAVKSIFPSSPEGEDKGGSGSLLSPDLLGLVSRFVLPLALNKTLFKKSNFIVKALVGLVSQKASSYISDDSVGSVWGKVKGIFNKKVKRPVAPVVTKEPIVAPPLRSL